MAHLDIGGVRKRPVECAAIGVHALYRPFERARQAVVDDRQARVEAVVALPAYRELAGNSDPTRRGYETGPLAVVVGLELIDVGRECSGRLDRSLESLE